MLQTNDRVLKITGDEDIEVRDEYHSMHELYEHRMALTIALFHAWSKMHAKGFRVIKSRLHNDGTMFEGGYFIVQAITPKGQISYHYKLKHWDKFKIDEIDNAFPWDNSTSLDVLERLMKL